MVQRQERAVRAVSQDWHQNFDSQTTGCGCTDTILAATLVSADHTLGNLVMPQHHTLSCADSPALSEPELTHDTVKMVAVRNDFKATMQSLLQKHVYRYHFPQHSKSKLSMYIHEPTSALLHQSSCPIAGSYITSYLSSHKLCYYCKSVEIQELIILCLHVTPLTIWDSQNHYETFQGSRKCHLWQYHCLDADCGLGTAWPSAYHCESMPEPQWKQNIVSVSTVSATSSDSSCTAYYLIPVMVITFSYIWLLLFLHKSPMVSLLSYRSTQRASLMKLLLPSQCAKATYLLRIYYHDDTWDTFHFVCTVPQYFDLLINLFFSCATVSVIQKQQNKDKFMLPLKQSPSLHPYLNRISLKHLIPQG